MKLVYMCWTLAWLSEHLFVSCATFLFAFTLPSVLSIVVPRVFTINHVSSGRISSLQNLPDIVLPVRLFSLVLPTQLREMLQTRYCPDRILYSYHINHKRPAWPEDVMCRDLEECV